MSDNRTQLSKARLAKAHLIGLDRPQALEGGELKSAFAGSGALLPPYEPEDLLFQIEHCDALRPNVEAMAVNIDGYGHRIEAAIDLKSKNSDDLIGDALIARMDHNGQEVREPTAEEIATERSRLSLQIRREKARLESFIQSASHEGSFVSLRRRLRFDRESQGNAYAEILRNGKGEIARFRYVPAYLCRLLPVEQRFTEVTEYEQISAIEAEAVQIERKLRRLIQMDEVSGDFIYFREVGDPRTLSMRTGRYYRDEEELRLDEGEEARPATELLHWRIDWPKSPYGVPRWIAATPQIKGKRAAAEVNYFLFDNKSVPPLAIFVSGGKLAEGSIERIEKYLEELKGRDNWSKILLIEAESDNAGNAPKIEIHRLSKEITEDGLFLKYDAHCSLTIGGQWRIPRILRGDTEDFNRATAEAALQMAEDLVFAPERNEFDDWMNREILPSLGIFAVRFRSLTPISKNPERIAQQIERLSKAGAILPRDARELAEDVFNKQFVPISEDWQDRPIAFTLAGIQTGRNLENPEAEAEKLVGMKGRIEARAASQAERRAFLLREHTNGDLEIELTAAQMSELIER